MASQWLIVLAHASVLVACADGMDHELDESVTEEAVIGANGTPPPEIGYAVRDATLFRSRMAIFLVRDNLALGAYLARPTGPSTLWFENTAAVRNTIEGINTTMLQPGFAVYHLDRPAGAAVNRIDARSAAALTSITLQCWSPQGFFRSALVEVTGGTATTLNTRSVVVNEYVEAADFGAPCVTTTLPRKLVGFVTSANVPARTAVLIRAETMRHWVDGMVNLARVRDDTRTTGPYAISTDPAVAGARMCMDLPSENVASGVDVQQYPCHYNLNQLFYLDYSDITSTRPRVVSAGSGRCLDVEWGDATPGRTLQQYDCHTGPNQKFERRSSGNLVPDSGIAANLCIGVRGGAPTTTPALTEQQACSANPNAFHQQWRYDTRTLPPF